MTGGLSEYFMLSHSLSSFAFIRAEEGRTRHKLQDLHFAAAADAGSKAYSVSPQLPWQAEGTVSRDAKEAMWGRTTALHFLERLAVASIPK